MAKIFIEIEDCSKCPHWDTANQWSTDVWDKMEDWICKKANKKIKGSVEWHDKVSVPDWCPCALPTDKVEKEKFVDEFLDRLYMNGQKDAGLYILSLGQAENAARELYNEYLICKKQSHGR